MSSFGVQSNTRSSTSTCKSTVSCKATCFTFILVLHIISFIGIMISVQVLNTTFADIEFPGCCGFIEGNNQWDDSWKSIPGLPISCTISVIRNKNALEMFEYDDNIFVCGVQLSDNMNMTLCNAYDQGTIEQCLELDGHILSDVCGEDIISRASKTFVYENITVWYISCLAIGGFLIIFWLFWNFFLIKAECCNNGELDDCDICVLLLYFIMVAELAFFIMLIVYFSRSWNSDDIRTGTIDNSAEQWMMDTCSRYNYPIVLDVTEYTQDHGEPFLIGLIFSCIGLASLCVGGVLYANNQ